MSSIFHQELKSRATTWVVFLVSFFMVSFVIAGFLVGLMFFISLLTSPGVPT